MKKIEKVSEIASRVAIIEQIKEAGFRKIEAQKLWLKALIEDLDLKSESDYKSFDDSVTEIAALNYLKEYLQSSSMLRINWMANDDVSYIIPLQTLTAWHNAGVVTKYISYLRTEGIPPAPLTDSFFSSKSGFTKFLNNK